MNGSGDDPLLPPNATVLRPRPGGGATRRAGGPAPETTRGPVAAPEPAAARPTEQAAVADFVASGRNRLLAAAGPLLALGSRLQSAVAQADVETLRRQAMQAVRAFEEQSKGAGAPANEVTVASYVLCTFFDSAVFRTPWGGQSNWASQSLLAQAHGAVGGGEKFFEILERLQGEPARYIDLLELMYVCLALGFEGKHQGDTPRLARLQDEILAQIRAQRGPVGAPLLSPHWEGVTDSRSRVLRWLPWWVVGIVGLLAFSGTWIALRTQLSAAATPVAASLVSQGIEISYAPAPVPQTPNRLKPLLAELERQGILAVEEFGARTIVTFSGLNVFPSGSATLSPVLAPAVVELARALEQVPGQVMVIGHTDDQPVRSLRFQNNFELSRERALAVANALRGVVSDAARIEWLGVGDAEPRYRPVDTPENRARNRRVEVIHTAVTNRETQP